MDCAKPMPSASTEISHNGTPHSPSVSLSSLQKVCVGAQHSAYKTAQTTKQQITANQSNETQEIQCTNSL